MATADLRHARPTFPFLRVVLGAILAALSSHLASPAKAQDTLRVGLYHNPPKIVAEPEGTIDGFWPEIIAGLAEDLNFAPEYVRCSWADCLRMLEAGDIDVMPDVAYTMARSSRFPFGAYPVLYSWSSIVVRQESDTQTFADFEGRTIAVVAGSVQAATLSELVREVQFRVRVLPLPSMAAVIDAVSNGRADAGITNLFFATEVNGGQNLRILDRPFASSALHFAFAPETPRDLIDRFDLAIYQMQVTPGSVLEAARDHWIDQREDPLPRWVLPGLAVLVALLLAALIVSLFLRHLVRQRTAELRATVAELEAALDRQRRTEVLAMERKNIEALGRLVGGVAHDFNNLLTVVLGNLDEIERDAPGVAARVDAAAEAAARGAALTRQLLAFGRQAALEPQPIDLNELVRDLVAMARRTMHDRIALEVSLTDDDPVVHLDANSLKNALLNLILNARDAIAGQGTISIETACTDDPGEGFGDLPASPEGYAMVIVTDTGTGMTPDAAARAFEPFFTTKKAGEGTGMGLPMVQGFVRQSRGAVRLDSTPGEGTRITMVFPRHVDRETVDCPRAEADAPDVPIGLSVLFVEDRDDVREVCERQLRSLGCRVTTVADGAAGLEQLEDTGLKLDLLVTDIAMPGEIQGIELARRARRTRPALPVILMSGYAAEAVNAEDRGIEGAVFLRKPILRDDLARAIARVLPAHD